ncbi:type I-G CRISPR-associated protein, Cas3-extension family [Methylomagnum sp.]
MNRDAELALIGLDGGNPLAFLAALGTLRTIDWAWAERRLRMGWRQVGGAWRPVLRGVEADESGVFLAHLNRGLKAMKDQPALTFARDLTVAADVFAQEAGQARRDSHPGDRRNADFLAAFGSEATLRDERQKERTIQDTALRTMSGTGDQHFLGFMCKLIESTEQAHLASALLSEWRYTDPGPSMRWDPSDDRRYALRWGNPGNSSRYPIVTVRGANRLAVEGLPLLPTAPVGRRLETTGFSQRRGEGAVWTWPIWEGALALDTVRSVLALAELQAPQPDRRRLAARGVVEVFRCQRLTVGKYRNFGVARPA